MLNVLVMVLVFGFVAIAALGHVLLFTAVVLGKRESREGALSDSLSRLHEVSGVA